MEIMEINYIFIYMKYIISFHEKQNKTEQTSVVKDIPKNKTD